jgi:hypothetical protein
MHMQRWQKKAVFILIILTSMKFYQLRYIPYGVLNMSQLMGVSLILFFNVVYLIYVNRFKNQGQTREHRYAYFFLIATFFSFLGAYWFHGQSFVVSLTSDTVRPIYYYGAFFLLINFNFTEKEIKDFIIAFALVASVFYLIQYAYYPNRLFDVRISQERGTIRIFLTGFRVSNNWLLSLFG